MTSVMTPLAPAQISTTFKTDYCGNVIYENGAVSRILTEEGYITLAGTTPTYHYYLKDHQGNNRVVINQSGTVEQVNHYYPFGGLMGESTAGGVQPYKYNGKELDRMHGLDLFDYGARHYDAAIGRWHSVDPLAEKYYSISPYAYVANNPVRFIDPDGMRVNPIYDEYGNFQGTDDRGLKGEAIVMQKKDFKQGMSHEDALEKGTLYGELPKVINPTILDKIESHHKALPNRPDYDGYINQIDANDWYRNGKGEPLFTDLNKIDLSNIRSLGEKHVGDIRTFNLFFASNSLIDALVYGQITLKRYPNHQIKAYSDTYNFEMHNWSNPLNWGRNAETVLGGINAGKGTPYTIHIYGSKTLKPYFPWTK
mgnify:FL=1